MTTATPPIATDNNLFTEFPKLARLNRQMIITEKLDGTNAQVFVTPVSELSDPCDPNIIGTFDQYAVFAGSRSRWVTPEDDNYGFARWVRGHIESLALMLGPGRHFGEWWGNGIQRGYGLANGDKRFSLFNTTRWCPHDAEPQPIPSNNPKAEVKYQDRLPACCGVVPVLYTGLFNSDSVTAVVSMLRAYGSKAAPGFMKPEGVVVYHVAGNSGFKVTLEKDDQPKGKG